MKMITLILLAIPLAFGTGFAANLETVEIAKGVYAIVGPKKLIIYVFAPVPLLKTQTFFQRKNGFALSSLAIDYRLSILNMSIAQLLN